MANKKPVDTIRMGALEAAIWENESDNRRFHNVTFSRSYLTASKQWEHSDSFGTDDLLGLAKLADLAHSRIFKLRADAKKPAEGSR